MDQGVKVGIIGDYDPNLSYHVATDEALGHAAAALKVPVVSSWIPTLSLEKRNLGTILDSFHGLWCSPGSPYKSMDGALQAIRFAREKGRPFIGT